MATPLVPPPMLGEISTGCKIRSRTLFAGDTAVTRYALPALLQSICFKMTPYTVTVAVAVCLPDCYHDVLTAARWCGALSG